MKFSIPLVAALILAINVYPNTAHAGVIGPPYDIAPFDTDALGNAARNSFGNFRRDGGPEEFRYFLGTNTTPGTLIMRFAAPIVDVVGKDFAVLTSAQSWGSLADTARFDFFFAGTLQGSFSARLAPGQLFEFDFPSGLLAVSRITITNTTPDPPGINDLATMTFDAAAGISTGIVPEPSSAALLLLAFVAAGLLRRRIPSNDPPAPCERWRTGHRDRGQPGG